MKRDTKSALMDAAEHAVRRNGMDGFSYSDLADSVGIRKASIHYHFPTKAALSEALMDRYHQTLSETCAEIDATAGTAAQRLLRLTEFYRAALGNGETLCLCVAFLGSSDSLSPDLKTKIRAFRDMMTTWLEDAFAQGMVDGTIVQITDARLNAAAALAQLEGGHLAARASGNVDVFDDAVAVLNSRCIDQP